MIQPKFPSSDLVGRDGAIYAHIFENPEVGISRNLFWSVTVNFNPLEYAGEARFCAMTCEWIPWAIRDWRELDKKHLNVKYGDQGIESSFYMMQHDVGTRTRLWLAHRTDTRFNVKMEMNVDFKGYLGGDEESAMQVIGSADVSFTGVSVVPGNLELDPLDVDEIKKVASPFIDLSRYYEPKLQDHEYVFKPKL